MVEDYRGIKKKYISYGAGVGSTGLICYLYDDIDQYELIFVNHGGDYPETYEYLDYIQNALKIKVTELKPNIDGFSSLYDYLSSNKIAPTRAFKFCTDKAKIRTIHRYCHERPYITLHGITFDERHRATGSSVKYEIIKYPLVDARIDRKGAIKLIKDMGLRVPHRSCCWFCFNATYKEIEELKREYPELYKAREELYRNDKMRRLAQQGQCDLSLRRIEAV